MLLSQEQIDQYHNRGYVVVQNVLTEEDLAPVISAYAEFIDRRAQELKAEGKIENLFEDEPFERRFANLFAESQEIQYGLDIMEARLEPMFNFLRNDNLLDVVESLLGKEITCNPIQHIRGKVPAEIHSGPSSLNVPWHQDAAVTTEEADQSDIITFWLPLVDAVAETGCMEVIPDVWKQGELRHYSNGGTTIVPEQMPKADPVLVPCLKGGIVIMNKYTPHRGTWNVSDIVRWSIDLRYQRTGEPTGRPSHPDFVVRSEANPDSELNDYTQWCEMWKEALSTNTGQKLHRV